MPRKPSAAAAAIGAQVTRARRSFSLTQDELAVRAGIDSSKVRSYESGRAMPSVHTLLKLSTSLSVEPGYLLENVTLDLFDAPSPSVRHSG